MSGYLAGGILVSRILNSLVQLKVHDITMLNIKARMLGTGVCIFQRLRPTHPSKNG